MKEKKVKGLRPRRSLSRGQKKKRVILILGIIGITLLWMYVFDLTIRMEGSANINLEYGDRYAEQGASVCISTRFFPENSIVLPFLQPACSSDLKTDTLGKYMVSYSASFLGKKATAQRQVCVIDTVSPEISFSRDWGSNHVDVLYGITATDNYDGDITDRVTYTRTTGWVTYFVMDSSGNPTYIFRELPTDTSQPPEITLEGEETCAVTVGSLFADPGYSARDSQNTDLTEYVTVEGEVDWLTPGEYTLTYTVSDSGENTASVTRKVIVKALPRPEVKWPEQKTIYLTFDDGPGPYTEALLDLLERYGARATFFVTDSGYDGVMGEIVRRGHSIGIHTVSHNYAQIYASPEQYFEDVFAMQDIIYQNTGVMTTLLRFPGGSSNMVSVGSYQGIMSILTEAVQDAGFQYFDWNVDSGDASGTMKAQDVAQNVMDGIGQKQVALVLLHDIHDYSVEAVETILQWGLENGYTFRPLAEYSPGFHHNVQN